MGNKFDPAKLAHDHYGYHRTGDDNYFWAIDLWWSLVSSKERSEYLIALLENAPMADLNYLGCIGAGPLEDLGDAGILKFISELRAIDIDRDSEIDRKLCLALQMLRFQPCGEPLTNAENEIIKYIKHHYPSFVQDGMFHTS
jgi:hypothetical protein